MMNFKMYVFSISIILGGSFQSLQAQTGLTTSERIGVQKTRYDTLKNRSLLWPKHKINLTPSSLFSTYHPGLELGYEQLHGNRFSTEFHFSKLISRANEYARNTNGYLLGFELKYFFANHKETRWYYALAIERLKKTHEADLYYGQPRDNEYEQRDRSDYTTRRVTIEKAFFNWTARIGVQQYIGSHFVIDAYVGVGRRYRKVSHLNGDTIDLIHQERDYKNLDLEFASNRKASEHTAKFDLNFRIAWTF